MRWWKAATFPVIVCSLTIADAGRGDIAAKNRAREGHWAGLSEWGRGEASRKFVSAKDGRGPLN